LLLVLFVGWLFRLCQPTVEVTKLLLLHVGAAAQRGGGMETSIQRALASFTHQSKCPS
jgi:hypothetical protein